jgi:hypothetical protein
MVTTQAPTASRSGRRARSRPVGTSLGASSSITAGFQPLGRRRIRMLVGVVMTLGAIGGNLVIYSSMDSRTEVLQVVRDVPAGTQLAIADLRVVEVWLDPRVNAVSSERLSAVIGAHAKVRLASGSLLVEETLQADSLVAAGAAVVAIQISDGSVPLGLRERSEILVVIPPPPFSEFIETEVISAVVVAPPTVVASSTGRVAISLEVSVASAVLVAQAENVRILLLDPNSVITREDLLFEQPTSQGQGS